MNRCCYIVLLLFALLAMASCHPLRSESGLYDVKLTHTFKAAVDGGWTWGKGNPYRGQKQGRIYIAPMDISLVKDKEPECAPMMVKLMHGFMTEEMRKSLADGNRANGTDWQLTDNPAEADIVVRIALVHFRRQQPVLKAASTVGGTFLPVPGVGAVVGTFLAGDICIEATVRDAHTNQLYVALKDSNRKTTQFYSADAYSSTGNADANLRTWAHKLARLFRAGCEDVIGDGTIRQKIEDRNLIQAMKPHIDDFVR